MQLRKNDIGLILMAITLILWACSCNPTKRVLQSKEKTERVVAEYVKANPAKNDTLYIPGEVILRDTTFIDTVLVPFKVDKPFKVVETRVIEKKVTDTIRITDRSLLEAVSNRLTKLEGEFKDMKADRDYWRQQARVRLYALILLLVIAIAAAVGWLWLKFQPRIRIEK